MIHVTIYTFKKYKSLYANQFIDTPKQRACDVNTTWYYHTMFNLQAHQRWKLNMEVFKHKIHKLT